MLSMKINERPDLRYDILLDGVAEHLAVGRTNLQRYLERYGIIGTRYDSVLRQLERKGAVQVEISWLRKI